MIDEGQRVTWQIAASHNVDIMIKEVWKELPWCWN